MESNARQAKVMSTAAPRCRIDVYGQLALWVTRIVLPARSFVFIGHSDVTTDVTDWTGHVTVTSAAGNITVLVRRQ